MFDVLIFSEYRAKGITNLIFSYLKNFMKDNKKLNCYTIVDNTNFKSKNMVIKNGFLKIGYFITIKFKDKRKIIVDTWR
ncbi:MAG: hypothetical protein WAO56_09965 [Miniphocaeibacter sp.]|uniref:hypothetical protein n=2 Tax=Miniphocaeibacter sp. TaxID=3100973 RepID=UPI00180AFBC8|nr:hypothetical protein [Gallicola sp.]